MPPAAQSPAPSAKGRPDLPGLAFRPAPPSRRGGRGGRSGILKSAPRTLCVGLVTDDWDWAAKACEQLHPHGLRLVTADLDCAEDPRLADCPIVLLKPTTLGGACWSACLALANRAESLLVFVFDPIEVADYLLALELGADDCISARLDPRETAARLRALARRFACFTALVQSQRLQSPVYYFDGWRFAPALAELRAPSGRVHSLSSNDMRLLAELLRRPGEFITAHELSRALTLGSSAPVDCRSRVHRLRARLLRTEPEVAWLKTVYGRGYCLSAQVRRREEAAAPSEWDLRPSAL